jgi:hypothetical protein
LIESFKVYHENVKDKADLNSNSQYLDLRLERPALSSFLTYLLEKDTLEVLILKRRDSTKTSLEVNIATPLITDLLTL